MKISTSSQMKYVSDTRAFIVDDFKQRKEEEDA